MPTSIYYLFWVGKSSELGHRRRRGSGGAEYWVIVCLGHSSTIPESSQEEKEGGGQGKLRVRQEPIGWNIYCYGYDNNECSPWQPMRLTLILAMIKIVMTVVTAVMMMLKTAQNREIIMKRYLTPLDLKTFF